MLLSKDNVLKLCDFGFARTLPESPYEITDYVATRWYRSPELLLNSKTYDKSVDLWATACIMGELIDSKPLFPGEDDLDQLYLVQRTLGPLTGMQLELLLKSPKFGGKLVTTGIEETLQARYRGKMSQQGLELMASLLKIDPKNRLTAERALQHPFFDGIRHKYETIQQGVPPLQLNGTLSFNGGHYLSRNDSKQEESVERKNLGSIENAAESMGGIENEFIAIGNGKTFSLPRNGIAIIPTRQSKGSLQVNNTQATRQNQHGGHSLQQKGGSYGKDTIVPSNDHPEMRQRHSQENVNNGVPYHHPLLTFDITAKKKHGDSFQLLKTKRQPVKGNPVMLAYQFSFVEYQEFAYIL